ncbi:hypothetical protein AB5J62_17635 [Amycolatopsis sp. cg5]|uniref:hypothetical protein n=1 Tax=Amycolatopsis sp. cg5 TaxID=3238802 RepID=UPI00352603F1
MKTVHRFCAAFFTVAALSSVVVGGASAGQDVTLEPGETLTMMSEAQYRATYGEPALFDNRPFTGREKLVYASDSVPMDPPLY